jgi:hypothetical protein
VRLSRCNEASITPGHANGACSTGTNEILTQNVAQNEAKPVTPSSTEQSSPVMPIALEFFVHYAYGILFLWVLIEQRAICSAAYRSRHAYGHPSN